MLPSVTPGRITSIWLLLKLISKYNELPQKELLKIAFNSSLRGGSLPISDGFELAKFGGFIQSRGNRTFITQLGEEVISTSSKEEPDIIFIRNILFSLVLKTMPPWVTFAIRPLEERIIAISEKWKEVLNKAELLNCPLSVSAKQWWENLQNKIDKIERENLKKIGNAGESLTIGYEKKRLLIDQYYELAENIKWVSKESDAYGFDISSFFGSLFVKNKKFDDSILIEVKSTTSDSNKIFRFLLTRNEWECAEKNIDNYIFYLWKSVKITKKKIEGDGPIILSADYIRQYVPLNSHERGKWTKCRIELDLLGVQSFLLNK